MLNAAELGDRRQRVLRAVVREYTRSAQPVASETLVRRYRLGVSSATVRNDLAFLEEAGLLSHPHTSAGRVPTDRGYRFFTEWLMGAADLDRDEQMMVRHQFHQVHLDTEEWSRLAASVLARLSTIASLVTPPHPERSRLRHLEIVPVQEGRGLLVMVLVGGAVRQQLLELSAGHGDLHALSATLSRVLGGAGAADAHEAAANQRGLARAVVDTVARVLEEQDGARALDVYYDGFGNLLQQPEFVSAAALRGVLGVLEDRTRLVGVFPDKLGPGQVRIVIGAENALPPLRQFSLVFGSYGRGASGFIGVVGPTRMDYARSIGVVRYVSGLMTELMGAVEN